MVRGYADEPALATAAAMPAAPAAVVEAPIRTSSVAQGTASTACILRLCAPSAASSLASSARRAGGHEVAAFAVAMAGASMEEPALLPARRPPVKRTCCRGTAATVAVSQRRPVSVAGSDASGLETLAAPRGDERLAE